MHNHEDATDAYQPAPSNSRGPERFAPGTLLAARYRVVGPLGIGGMGEVYRADDLTLGEPVALKFLPIQIADDPDRLARLRMEVAAARKVSHPNVCRVHDIVEHDGESFVTMEFVDGEDLSSLLKRVGRMPEEKGIEIARQLCGALAAVHDQGLLHRDLKPANVMLDGRGKVRLTDFGLAATAMDLHGREVFSGTPLYQAPEQLDGSEVTVRSDIYALGLVLYELFTGKRAFVDIRRSDPPSKPSSHVSNLDTGVERTILRCLETQPSDRPRSAVELLASLPGGDPLAEALAVGQTPSPQMVADAGGKERLSLRLAGTLLITIVVLLAVFVLLSEPQHLHRKVGIPKSPHELANRAREVLDSLGYATGSRNKDHAHGFMADQSVLEYLFRDQHAKERRRLLRGGQPAAMYFWYRESPTPLVAKNVYARFRATVSVGEVTASEPPLFNPGMVATCLDPNGRLIEFLAVPSNQDTTETRDEPNWEVVFGEAGLDWSQFENRGAASEWIPPVFCDQRLTWSGHYPDTPDIPIRIEGASRDGRVVYFFVGPPDTRERLAPSPTTSVVDHIWASVIIGQAIIVWIGGGMLAYRNRYMGRANIIGARRLALYVFGVFMISGVVWADHTPIPSDEIGMVCAVLGWSAYCAGTLWVAYLAGEPYVRRRWPWQVIGWNRLLDGRLRDSRVGRDILIGGVFGLSLSIFLLVIHDFRNRQGIAPPSNVEGILTHGLYYALHIQAVSVMVAITWSALVFIFYLIFRRGWLAVAVFFAVMGSLGIVGSQSPVIDLIGGVVYWGVFLVVLLRFGFLALVFAMYFLDLPFALPITTDLSAWYATDAIVPLLWLVGLAGYAFVVAVGDVDVLRRWIFVDT